MVEEKNERGVGRDGKLSGRKLESEVGLGDGGDMTSERGCHEGLIPRKDVHRDKTRFVEVYREPSGCGEIVKNKLEMRRGPSLRPADDKRVIRILEDGAGVVGGRVNALRIRR
jgi:hypothetical protein